MRSFEINPFSPEKSSIMQISQKNIFGTLFVVFFYDNIQDFTVYPSICRFHCRHCILRRQGATCSGYTGGFFRFDSGGVRTGFYHEKA